MLRVAVLGAGRIGKIHAANVAGNPKARLVTIADPYGTAAGDLADHLGSEASLDPMRRLSEPMSMQSSSARPTDTHVSLTLHAVKMGKAVLCEKPIDLDIAKVDAASKRSTAQRPRHGGIQPSL
jgi:Predicted dehydrogenases and related proteins